MTDKTCISEDIKPILQYFTQNLNTYYNENVYNFSLIFKESHEVKESIVWAYSVFLLLLHNRQYANCNYRDLVKSESFTNLLTMVNNSNDPEYSRLLFSQISIDFSSLINLLHLKENAFHSCREGNDCWNRAFYNVLSELKTKEDFLFTKH